MFYILLMIILIIIIITLHIGIRIVISLKNTEGCIKILIFRKIKAYSIEFPHESRGDENNRDFKKLYKLAKPCFYDFKIFLDKFIKAIEINNLKAHLIFGKDNFADTGTFIGYIWAILGILNSILPKSKLTAEPCFKGEKFDFTCEANIDINILKLIIPAIRLISKKQVRELVKGVRNEQ